MSLQIVERVSREKPEFSNPVVRWIDYRLPIFTFLHHELNAYPTPRNLNYLWNFVSLAGMALMIMIATGIVLAMHYVPTGEGAFRSVEHIMRDVNYGWLIRYIHTTGASMFFSVVYIHIFRGLYYGLWLALSRIGAAYYFVHFFVVLPVVGAVERPRPLPFSISQAVLPATGKAP
jgi:ubiquinol-cytochrome c reductase cytochrome b subunit